MARARDRREILAVTYFCDFTRMDSDGWLAYGIQSVVNGEFRAQSPFVDDFNHDELIGTLNLLAYRYWEHQRADGSFDNPDLSNRRLRARICFQDWVMPPAARILIWAQARIPGTGPDWKYSNWGMTGAAIDGVADGNWHVVDRVLEPSGMLWSFGGGPPPSYAFASIGATLANIHNLMIVVARPQASAIPTGICRIDWIRLD